MPLEIAERSEMQIFRLLIADLREDARWLTCQAMSDRLTAAADYMAKHPPADTEKGEAL